MLDLMLYFNLFSRYELRVRYLPRDFHHLLAQDRVTFYYFYDQVNSSIDRHSGLSFSRVYKPKDIFYWQKIGNGKISSIG